ncbi:MAG: methyltransferase domain-containing protein [bacterium]|nr:methyltransferase domain-containing protein [bacterium]
MNCPICDGSELREFFDGGEVPVFCNVLYSGEEAARAAPRAGMLLGFCDGCALVFNVAFDPKKVEYAAGYENSLHGSPHFQAYADTLASGLVERHALARRPVVEIGGGRGEFMELLLEHGAGPGAVFDPSVPPGGDDERSFEVVRQPFDASHLERPFGLIATRHVLEHIPAPRTFVRAIAAALEARTDAALYLEIPNGLWTFRDRGIWDLIYEHCSYYAPCTLRRLLALEGIERVRVEETFGGQFLAAQTDVTGPPGSGGHEADVAEVAAFLRDFADTHTERVEHWSERLEGHAAAGRSVAVWGAGSKGVTFLNSVRDAEAVRWVVDVNPLKAGQHVAGTGQKIVEPGALVGASLDEVIVMNPIYKDEIAGMLAERGVNAPVVTVG